MTETLKDKLRAAECGSPELDHEIMMHFGARHEHDWCDEYWFGDKRFYSDAPSQKIDDALWLIEEVLGSKGLDIRFEWNDRDQRALWILIFINDGRPASGRGKHEDRVLALILALLDALAAKETGDA